MLLISLRISKTCFFSTQFPLLNLLVEIKSVTKFTLSSLVTLRLHGLKFNIAFNSWTQVGFPVDGVIHDTYRAKCKVYRQKLRNFLNQREVEKSKMICHAADSDEKLFWTLIKGQRSSSQMSAFFVDGNFLTDKDVIRDMWADHFEVPLKITILIVIFSPVQQILPRSY